MILEELGVVYLHESVEEIESGIPTIMYVPLIMYLPLLPLDVYRPRGKSKTHHGPSPDGDREALLRPRRQVSIFNIEFDIDAFRRGLENI